MNLPPVAPARARLADRLALRPDEATSRRARVLTVVAVVAIVALGVALRLVWLARVGWHTGELQWHDTPLLTSPDGYWFAAGAGQHLSGAWGANPRLPGAGDHALVALAWLGARVGPWTLDQVIAYLPALLGALVAVPMVALGRALGVTRLGLVAALALVTAPVLFARTAAGYFDTDAFALGVPLVVVAHLVALLERGRRRDAGWAAAWLAAYPWFYNQGGSLGLALAVTAACALAWRRARDTTGDSTPRDALVLLALSQLPLHPFVRVPLVALAYGGLALLARRHPATTPRASRAVRIALALGVAAAGAVVAWKVVPLALAKLAYFVGDAAPVGGPVAFGNVGASVAETQAPSLGDLVERLGPAIVFAVALAGVAATWLRYRSTLVLLPLAALGAFATFGGLRFAIYATPVLALGLAYALVWLADRVRARRPSALVLGALTAAALAPSVARDWVMFTRPPLVAAEVSAMTALARRAPPTGATPATTIAWWDDGYALLYFARTRTLVDGGWREADVGLAAEILMQPSQRAAANLARLAVATRDDELPADWAIAPTLFQRELRGGRLADLFARLGRPDTAVPARAPIYLYLPLRLLAIVPVIDRLRPTDAGAPPTDGSGVYRFAAGVTVSGNTIKVGGAEVDAATVTLREAGGTRPLRTLYSVRGSGERLEVRQRAGAADAPTSGIYLYDPGIFIELDDHFLSSSLVQLLVFEKADAGAFAPVFANGAARVYEVVAR